LEFEITANAGKLSDVLEETKRRIQGFSDATAAGGEDMEKAFEQAAATIERAWRDIDAMSDIHNAALADLQKQYAQVGKAAGEAFMRGTADGDKEYRQLIKQQDAIGQQISQRQKLIGEIAETADALLKEEANFEKVRDKADKNSNSQAKLASQLRNMQYELAAMEEAGQRGSEGYAKLRSEAARLADALRDARTQAKILSHDNAGLQGVIAGVSGLTGAFSAAQGAVALFSGENENLQKIMLRVQSLMGITIGLQQVANTLNKDSAFRLVTLNGLQEWWNTVKAKATIAQIADTAATTANTAAKSTNTVATTANTTAAAANAAATTTQAAAATAGTAANIGLAGAFRLVGAAITSIPGIGWILAGVTALVAVVAKMTKETREAKKQQKEMNQAIAEIAGKPLASIQQLSKAYSKLGDDLKAKEKFIDENRDKFDQLGVAVNSVKDAENLLITNKQAFIESQIMKAKAMAATELAAKKYQEALEKAMTVQEPNKYRGTGADRGKTFDTGSLIQQFGRSQSADSLLAAGKIEINPAWEEYNKKVERSFADANKLFEQAAQFSLKEKQILEQIGQSLENITAGSITALENNITKLNEKYKLAKTDDAREALAQEIQEQQALLEKIDVLQKTGGTTTKSGGDPFLEILEARKKKYEEYYKWVNSGDEIVRKAAQTEFSGLLEEGSTYLDYLKNQRAQLTSEIGDSEATARQTEELRKLNQAIATETKDTVLAQFEEELKNQLNGAQGIMQMLDIIEQRRKQLTGDGSEIDTNKAQILEKSQEDVVKKAEEETNRLISEYSNYLGKKIELELEFTNDLQLLEKRRAKAATETDKKAIDDIIKNRKAQYNEDKANLLYAGYEATRAIIDLAQDKVLLSISNKAFMWESDRIKSALEIQKQAAEKTLEELKKIHREAPTEAIALEIEKVKIKIEELNAELEKMPKAKFQEMLTGFQKITSALGNLDGTVGEIFSNISREVDNIKVAFDDTATKTDKVSAGIAAVVDLINMVASASEERKRKEKEFYNAALAFAHDYALALNEQLRLHSELSDSGFITDYQAKINSGFEAMAEATNKYEEALAKLSEGQAKTDLRDAVDWGNVGKGAAAGAAAGAAIGSIIPAIGTAIGAVVGGAIGAIAGLFGGKKKEETFGGLLEVFPELVDSTGNLNKELAQSLISTNQLDEETKLLVQNALDWADAIEDANEQIGEVVADLAGDLGNNIRNSIVEAWKAGEDASKRMFEVAGESLEKFIEQLVFSALFSDVFKDFKKDLETSLDPMKGDGDVVDDYDRLMDRLNEREDLYVAALEAIRQRAKERGFDLWGNENDNTAHPPTSLSGAIKGASQESIDLLAGQTNAVRIQQAAGNDILREQLLHLASIDMKVGISNELLSNIYNSLRTQEASDPLRAQGITL
ncbi:MAG: glycine zipper domain-containing protein, partial [Acetivibrionales bacterium]